MWAWIVKSEPILFHHAALTVSWAGPHTDLTDLTEFFFDGVKSHRGWQMGRGACLSTPSALSTQISKNSHKLFLFNLLNLCELFHQQIRICVRIELLNDIKKVCGGWVGVGESLRNSEIYR